MISLVLQPILTSLAASGLNLLKGAVLAKGQDFIEEKLGVQLDTMVKTEEGVFKLKSLEIQHEEFLLSTALTSAEQERKYDLDNTLNARNTNAKIQETANASFLAKNTGYLLDFVIVFAVFGLSYVLMFRSIPDENREILLTVFGALIPLCLTVIQFHRGSSRGSSGKDETIQKLTRGMK